MVNTRLQKRQLGDDVGYSDLAFIAYADSPYTVLDATETVHVDSTLGAVSVLLPAISAANAGRRITIRDAAGWAELNNITLTPAGSDTIESAASTRIRVNREATTLESDGVSEWAVQSNNQPRADVFWRELDTADFQETLHYTVVTNASGVTRDVNNRIVLTANDSVGAITAISLKPLLRLPFFHVMEVRVEIAITSSVQDYAGTTGTQNNTRFGIRHYSDGFTEADVTPKWAEVHVGKSSASNWLCSPARFDGTTWTRANSAAQTNLALIGTLALTFYHGSTAVSPQIAGSTYAGWGAGTIGNRGSALGSIDLVGVDFDTEIESGEVTLYVNLGNNPSGKDMSVVLKRMIVRDFPGKLHP